MLSGFDNVAVIHDQDQIGIADRGEAVSDDEACASLHEVLHAFLDQDFGTGIDGGRCLIENQNLRIGKEGSGNGEQLLLALGDVGRLFIDFGLITVS